MQNTKPLQVSYTTIKTLLGNIPSYYLQQGTGDYDLFAVGSEVFISSRLTSQQDITDFQTHYIQLCTSVASPDDALVLGLVANKVPLVQPRTQDGKIKVSQEKTSGDRLNHFTHNFTDKTTWYQTSTYIQNQQATNSGNNTNYTLPHQYLIDTYHGKLTFEDNLVDSSNNSYRVQVKVNNILKIEQDPHFNSGGDYIVNYPDGIISFLTPLNPQDTVTVSYHYATSSLFIIKPQAATTLLIDHIESQFSLDVEINDSLQFEVYGIADFFLTPQQMQYLGIPSGINYKIMLQRHTYKTMTDFYNDTVKSYPIYKAIGNPSNWRSQKTDVTLLVWDYLASIPLSSKKGMEIHIKLQHDTPFDGYLATASVYCLVATE
jgi:hypothetical protein